MNQERCNANSETLQLLLGASQATMLLRCVTTVCRPWGDMAPQTTLPPSRGLPTHLHLKLSPPPGDMLRQEEAAPDGVGAAANHQRQSNS